MISAVFYRKNGRLNGFTVSGHAGAAAKGMDIVCAAVSACVELAANGVTEVLGLPGKVVAEDDTVRLRIPDDAVCKASSCLLRSLRLELKQIAEEYPQRVRVCTKDCL